MIENYWYLTQAEKELFNNKRQETYKAFHPDRCEVHDSNGRLTLLYKTDSLGRKYFIEYCEICKYQVRIKKNKYPMPIMSNAKEALNGELYKNDTGYLEAIYWLELEFTEIAKVSKEIHEQKYSEYLNSQEWQVKRKLVLERDDYICQGCRKNKAVQVHHLTYERIYDEMLFDLISVCRSCHRLIHAKNGSMAVRK